MFVFAVPCVVFVVGCCPCLLMLFVVEGRCALCVVCCLFFVGCYCCLFVCYVGRVVCCGLLETVNCDVCCCVVCRCLLVVVLLCL